MPRFAANLSMMFNEAPFLDRFDAAARAGFEAVEYLFPYDFPAEEIAERLQRNNLTQALFNLPPGDWAKGERGLAALPERTADFDAALKTALPYAKATGVKKIHMMAGLADRKNPLATASYKNAVQKAAEFFAPHGIAILLEPINARGMPGYFLNDFPFTAALIEELGLPNVKLQFDIFHRQIIHGDVVMALRAMFPLIGHVQVASVPSRHEPMSEELNDAFIFAELDRLGYDGYIGCEYIPAGGTVDGLGWLAEYRPALRSIIMAIVLGCIADDYTGASDLANTLKKAGLRTVQTIGVPAADYVLPDVDAVVLSLKSRSIDPAKAIALSLNAYAWLKGQGASHILFKICSTFDSTDRGNIGPVMDALLEKTGDDCIIVTPAFPETKRTVYMGNLFVGHVPLNESPLKDHPLNPMHDSNLVRVLQRQSKNQIGLVGLATITKGAAPIKARMKELARDGVRAVIVDTVFDADLGPIGDVAADAHLSVGASGLGLGLAQAFVKRGRGGSSEAALAALAPSASACLAGSCSQATLGQVAAAEKIMPVFRLDPADLMERRDAYLNEIVAWSTERLPQGPILIASTATPDRVRALQGQFGQAEIGHAIEQAMADLAERLVEKGVRRLVVAGGETSGAVVDRLGVPGFVVGPEIAAGVPVLGASGYRHPMLIALKSGNFGGPDFFADALKLMA